MFDISEDGYLDVHEVRKDAMKENNDQIVYVAGTLKLNCGLNGVRLIPAGVKLPSMVVPSKDYRCKPDRVAWYGEKQLYEVAIKP